MQLLSIRAIRYAGFMVLFLIGATLIVSALLLVTPLPWHWPQNGL